MLRLGRDGLKVVFNCFGRGLLLPHVLSAILLFRGVFEVVPKSILSIPA